MPENNEIIIPAIAFDPLMARLNITWGGYNADLPDFVAIDLSDAELKRIAQEAVRNGFPGMPADPNANLTDFVIDPPVGSRPYPPTEVRPYQLLVGRPGTPFGE